MQQHLTIPSPIGHLTITANDNALVKLTFEKTTTTTTSHPILIKTATELAAYFKTPHSAFTTPTSPDGTPFQQSVYQALQSIPTGKTVCYQDIANTIKNPKAVRAVGQANGRNPIPIIIPCHRVINKNKTLGGYAFGPQVKQWLLTHEKRSAPIPAHSS